MINNNKNTTDTIILNLLLKQSLTKEEILKFPQIKISLQKIKEIKEILSNPNLTILKKAKQTNLPYNLILKYDKFNFIKLNKIFTTDYSLKLKLKAKQCFPKPKKITLGNYHYVYLITNKLNNKKYIGKRSSFVEPQLDLGKIYFSSTTNETFKQLLKNNPEQFSFEVLKTFPTSYDALKYESELHYKYDVRNNPNFYNLANSSLKTGFLIIDKITLIIRKELFVLLKNKNLINNIYVIDELKYYLFNLMIKKYNYSIKDILKKIDSLFQQKVNIIQIYIKKIYKKDIYYYKQSPLLKIEIQKLYLNNELKKFDNLNDLINYLTKKCCYFSYYRIQKYLQTIQMKQYLKSFNKNFDIDNKKPNKLKNNDNKEITKYLDNLIIQLKNIKNIRKKEKSLIIKEEKLKKQILKSNVTLIIKENLKEIYFRKVINNSNYFNNFFKKLKIKNNNITFISKKSLKNYILKNNKNILNNLKEKKEIFNFFIKQLNKYNCYNYSTNDRLNLRRFLERQKNIKKIN